MSADDLVAFVDESLKPVRRAPVRSGNGLQVSHYAMAAVVLLAGDLTDCRWTLRMLAGKRAKGLHYASLSERQRLEVVMEVTSWPYWDALVVETERPVPVHNDRPQRRSVLGVLLSELATSFGVQHIVLESRAHPSGAFGRLDRDDVLLAASLRESGRLPADVSVEHRGKGEAALALADLIVGARTDFLCGVNRAPWGAVAHRVRRIGVAPSIP
jgi:hypothetical protein